MNRYGPVQMSPKADLEASSEREHRSPTHVQHHHHHQHSQHTSGYPSHTSIQSLPIPASSSSGPRYGAPLPALQDPRYTAATTGPAGYDSTSPTSAASSVAYSPFSSNGFHQPTSYPTSATSSSFPSSSFPAYSLSSDSRPRIPSIVQSPTSGSMAPHHRSSSGSTKSVSPGLGGSSARADYSTSTPHVGRHLPSRSSQSEVLQSPHSPHSPLTPGPRTAENISPTIGSLTSPTGIPTAHDHGHNGLSVNHAGPPLGETQVVFQLSSTDGHLIRPEIHARVDKGFFLSERDWTCYRRNYFSVICSYSLIPSNYSLPLYLRRGSNSPPEPILSFAMCISAVVDAPGGKSVELVQHTPKRDKGPQHRPAKIKLNPQPAGGMTFASSSTPVIQQQPVHAPGPMDHEYTFPQQTQQQQQQHIAVFDRIQFKSATANNGKRRAAQQYYHLIVELYANLGAAPSSTPSGGANPDGDWLKIAYRISAPMVVRGRSPGHYADERRASTSSPGGGNTGGNNPGGPHATPHTSASGPGFMGPDGLSSAGQGGSNSGMNMHSAMHHHSSSISSPATSSIRNPSSIASASPTSHIEPPIDPVLDTEAPTSLDPGYAYSYVPTTLFEAANLPPQSIDSGYEPQSYHGDRKTEHALETSCAQFDLSAAYNATTMAESGTESLRKVIKSESGLSTLAVPWFEQRFSSNILPKCGRFEHFESSKGLFPNIPSL